MHRSNELSYRRKKELGGGRYNTHRLISVYWDREDNGH